MTPADYLALLNQAADVYAKLRELAAQNGATDAQLAEADARFRRYYADPLAGEKNTPAEPDVVDVTTWRFDAIAEAREATKRAPSHLIVRYADGRFGLWPAGVGPVPGEIVE